MRSKAFPVASALLWLAVSALPVRAEPPKAPAEITLSGLVVGTVAITVPDGVKIGYQPTFKDEELTFLELVAKKGQRAFLVQAKPDAAGNVTSGKHAIVWWTVGEESGATTVIIIKGNVNPTPPPGPGPVPPVPPGPTPPQSELGKKLQAAYAKSPDPAALALYQTAMNEAVNITRDQQYTTIGSLVKAINTNTKTRVGASVSKLTALGAASGEYLTTQLPADDGPLNQDGRAQFINAYATHAAALKEVKP